MPMSGKHPAPSPCRICKEDDELKALWQNYSTLAGRIDQLEVGLPVGTRDGEGLEADITGAIIVGLSITTQYKKCNFIIHDPFPSPCF